MNPPNEPRVPQDAGGPKIKEDRSPLDGLLEDPEATITPASPDKALWDPTRDKRDAT